MELNQEINNRKGYSVLLQYKSYLLIWSGNTISRFGDAIDSIALMWMIYKMTSSFVLMGSIMAVNALPSLLFGMAAGVYVDRKNKKTIMVAADLLRAISTFAITFLFISGKLLIWQLFIFSFYNSTCEVFASPARACTRQLLVRKEHYLQANSLWDASTYTASIIGTGAAAFILGLWGIGAAVMIDAFTFLLSAVSAIAARIEEKLDNTAKLSFKQFYTELLEGFEVIKANTALLITVIMICSVNLVLAPFNVLIPAYSDKILMAGSKGYSMIEAFFTVGIIAGSLIVGYAGQRFKMSTLVISGFAGLGIGIGLLSIVANLYIAILICSLSGAFIPLITTSGVTMLQQCTPKDKMGRVISTLSTIGLLGMPLGYAVSGFIAAGLSIKLTYLLVGAFILLMCVIPCFNKEFRKI